MPIRIGSEDFRLDNVETIEDVGVQEVRRIEGSLFPYVSLTDLKPFVFSAQIARIPQEQLFSC